MPPKSRSSVPIALILTGATLLFGCGGGDDSGTLGRRRIEAVRRADVGAGRREGGRLADRPRRLGRRLHRPQRHLLPVRLHGHRARRSRPSSATRRPTSTPSRCSPPPSRRSPTTARRSPTSSATTSSSRRRSTAPPPRPTSSTRSSAPLLPGVANGYSQTYLKGIAGFDDAVKQAQERSDRRSPRDQRDHDARRHDAGDQARRHELDRGRGRALAARVGPGPGGVREAVRRREPVDLRRAPGLERPVHDREQLQRRAHGLYAEQGDPPRPQPELEGLGRRLPARLPGRDHDPGGLRRHGLGRQEDPHRQRRGQRRLHRAAERDQAGGERRRARASSP